MGLAGRAGDWAAADGKTDGDAETAEAIVCPASLEIWIW